MNTLPKAVTQTLVEERQALQVYFDALLWDIPDDLPPEPEPGVAIPAVIPAVAPATATANAPGAERPGWGHAPFQAMLFKVCGLTLAVPLVELSGVQEWAAQKVTPLPSRTPWFLGLALHRDHNVPVVDTAQLVLPDDRRHLLKVALGERVTRIVFIDEGRFGLACDEVAEVVTVEPEQVRWRSLRTTRAWLAGTVVEHMCALIDPPAFACMLASGVEVGNSSGDVQPASPGGSAETVQSGRN